MLNAEQVKQMFKELPEMDMAGRIDLFKEMRDFARVALIAALERGAIHQGDDLVDQWEELTGEVYGEDYCARE